MAGNYMDAPNDRVAWDRDGSVLCFVTASGSVVAQSATTRRLVNSEAETGVSLNGYMKVAVVFPIPMDCTAIFVATSLASPTWTVETSKDTTNGVDGTWDTQFLTGKAGNAVVKPAYRILANLWTLQDNSSSSELRGIRLTMSNSSASMLLRVFHIYGQPSTLATKDRLAFWHPTTDTKLPPTYFDWGNVPRSTSADRSFRIKNLSATRTATDIDLYVEALTAGLPEVDNMHTISADGGATFLTGQTLVSLAPGEISDVLIVRRTVPADALISVWSARIAADVNVWEG